MNEFKDILQNNILLTALVSWLSAQMIKLVINFIREGELDWRLLASPGGMPSGHSATVMSVTISIGITQGWDSPLLALAASLAMVVMYDAAGIRRAAGEHAATLNRLIDRFTKGEPHERMLISPEELKEILGHTPFQVVVGACLGTLIAILMN